MKLIPVSIHEKTLRKLRCVVSNRPEVTLHHCHGGSMLTLAPEFPNPGGGQRNNPFFQIPLNHEFHTGGYGIDTGMGWYKGVKEWEEAFGTQLGFLVVVNGLVSYDLWEEAREWQQINRS